MFNNTRENSHHLQNHRSVPLVPVKKHYQEKKIEPYIQRKFKKFEAHQKKKSRETLKRKESEEIRRRTEEARLKAKESKMRKHLKNRGRGLKKKAAAYPIKRSHVHMTRRRKRDWERRLKSDRDTKNLKDSDSDLQKADSTPEAKRATIGVPSNLVAGKTTTQTLQDKSRVKSGVTLKRKAPLTREDAGKKKSKKSTLVLTNDDKIKIPRNLLMVPSYIGKGYDLETICRIHQKQAIQVAREIVTQQSKRLFSKLSNYLFKGKMLVNMTKLKVNRALKSKIRELLKPSHMGFTTDDIDALGIDPMSPLKEDLDEAEDFITDQTYNEFEENTKVPNVSHQDETAWNLN